MKHESIDAWGLGLIVAIVTLLEVLFLTGNDIIATVVIGVTVYLIGCAWGLDIIWTKECERTDLPGRSRLLKVIALVGSFGWPIILACRGYDRLKEKRQSWQQKSSHQNPEIVSESLT